MCRFIVWYQGWRPFIRLYILPPGHWTCSFVCHFNSTESIQPCSHFGAFNLSYTLPSLSYLVLIFTWVKWSIWGWSAFPKGTTLKQCPKIERGETWFFSENPARSRIRNRAAGSNIVKASRSNHCAMSLSMKIYISLFCNIRTIISMYCIHHPNHSTGRYLWQDRWRQVKISL